MRKYHLWDAPTIPPATPPTATVVIRSRCGDRINVPLWQVREWERAASKRTPDPADACPGCLAAA